MTNLAAFSLSIPYQDQIYRAIESASGFILNVIDHYDYSGIFIGMGIESIGIPLPSELIMPYGGYLAYIGHLNFITVVLIGTLACLAGSLVTYGLSYYGGAPLFEKYGRYVGIRKRELDVAQRWFDKYGQATVFFSRMIPGIRAYSSIPAGIFKMDIKKFSIYTFLGSLPWNIGLAYAGVYLGANWRAIESSYNRATIVILALLVSATMFLLYKYKIKKVKTLTEQDGHP
jgi:membrane protein DedA with SNARE-associated domain